VDEVEVLQIPVEEVKVKIPVSQVIRNLISQRFSAITIESMEIMHMSVGRENIINKKGQDHSKNTNSPSSPIFMSHTEEIPIVSGVE
jgi:hypothetical protein